MGKKRKIEDTVEARVLRRLGRYNRKYSRSPSAEDCHKFKVRERRIRHRNPVGFDTDEA